MNIEAFIPLVFLGAVAAGCLGALTGLGGGVVIISLLVLLFDVDLRYAIGASLVAVIATSSGSASAFIREGYTNVRVAMLLELMTTTGAIAGAILAGYVDNAVIMYVLVAVIFWSAFSSIRANSNARAEELPESQSSPLAVRLGLPASYPVREGGNAAGERRYGVRNVPGGMAIMFGAGVLSALVGIGSGVIKVVAMDRLMRLPFKVSTTTSNFMMGVTAAASAGVYFHRGQLEPIICGPVALGALVGSVIGTRLLARAKTRTLRVVFAIVVAIMGVQLLIRAITGRI